MVSIRITVGTVRSNTKSCPWVLISSSDHSASSVSAILASLSLRVLNGEASGGES